jgi:glycosyltransferase involved in cell wall biosynthesis
LEAFAMEKPVLVSDVSPFNEIVDDCVDGFMLPSDDFGVWSERIKFLLLDKEACRRMGQNGLSKVKDKFSFEKSMNNIQLLYENTLLNREQKKKTHKISSQFN